MNGNRDRHPQRVGAFLTSPGLRGALLFFTGLALTVREGLTSGPERPSLYVVYMGMMGFPFIPKVRELIVGKTEAREDDAGPPVA